MGHSVNYLEFTCSHRSKGPLSSTSDGFGGKSHLDLLSVGVNCVKLDAMLGEVDDFVGFT
jgi:hypothetical protein